jgi:hypothetical protein
MGPVRMGAPSLSLILTDWGHVAQYLGTVNTNPIECIMGENVARKFLSLAPVTRLY